MNLLRFVFWVLLAPVLGGVVGCSAGRTEEGRDAGSRDASRFDGSADAGSRPDACGRLCGTTCCAQGEVCEEGACLQPCEGTRCGAGCCNGDTPLCYGGACIGAGDACSSDRTCPTGWVCEPIVGACVPEPSGAECLYIPPTGVFTPEVEWRTEVPVYSTPAVAQTTDDNGDGRIDSRDVPDLVFNSGFYREFAPGRVNPILYARSGATGEVVWEAPIERWSVAGFPAAVADLEGDGSPEVVTAVRTAMNDSNVPFHVGAFEPRTMRWKWVSDERLNDDTTTGGGGGYPVTLSDLDGDGTVESIVNGRVFSSTGSFLWMDRRLQVPRANFVDSAPVIADVDNDGKREVIGSNDAFRFDGEHYWTSGARPRNLPVAIGDFLGDDEIPELVVVDQTRFWLVNPTTGANILGPVDAGSGGGFGTPTIPAVADYDGDGKPEFSMVRGTRFIVIDPRMPAPHIQWEIDINAGVGGRTSATVFDFDGDEAAEVIINGYCFVEIFAGADGRKLWQTPSYSQNSVIPVVADVDGDGNAELMISSTSAYDGPVRDPRTADVCGSIAEGFFPHRAGVRVFGDVRDNWVATRRVWNQYAYHIDNITEDNLVPPIDERSWTTHNTYRVNRVENATRAPDLRVRALDARTENCPSSVTLRALVENVGARGVLDGLPVAFYMYDGSALGDLLAVGATTRPLLWGESAWVEVVVPLDEDVRGFSFVAVADDNGSRGIHGECREDNNQSLPLVFECVDLI